MNRAGEAFLSGLGDYNQRTPQYDTLREIIHRRPSLRCTKPSLVRHRGWWHEGDIGDAQYQLSCFYDLLHKKLSLAFPNSSTQYEFEPTSEIGFIRKFAIFSGVCMSLYKRYSISLHDERVTLTQIIDVGYLRSISENDSPDVRKRFERLRGSDPFLPPEGESKLTLAQRSEHHLQRVMERASKLSALIREEKSTREAASRKGATDSRVKEVPNEILSLYREPLREDADELFDQIWVDVDEKLGMSYKSGQITSKTTSPPSPTLHKFADFRGVVLPYSLQWESYDKFQDVFGPNDSPTPEDHSVIIKSVWPFLRSSEPRGGDKSLSDKDVVACSMLAGKCLYLSTLGSMHLDDNSSHSGAPIKYIAVSSLSYRWENGRFIDDINRLGIYRLMAFRDFGQLRWAGNRVRQSGSDLDLISQKIFADHTGANQHSVFNVEEATARELSRKELSKSFMESQTFPGIYGGLQYRIYRSTTYADAFRKLVFLIGSEKVHGYRDYKETMSRQAEGVFDYIKSLGLRSQNLTARYLAMMEFLEMNQISEMQKERNKIVRHGEKFELLAYSYYFSYAFVILITGMLLVYKSTDELELFNAKKELSKGIVAVVVFVLLYFLFAVYNKFRK